MYSYLFSVAALLLGFHVTSKVMKAGVKETGFFRDSSYPHRAFVSYMFIFSGFIVALVVGFVYKLMSSKRYLVIDTLQSNLVKV